MSDVLSSQTLSTDANLQTDFVETPSPTVSGVVMYDFSFYPDLVDISGTLDAGSTLSAISADDTNFIPVTNSGSVLTTGVNGQYLTFSANTETVFALAPIAGETQSDINAINAALAGNTALTDTFYFQEADNSVVQINVQLDDVAIGTHGTVSPGVSGTFAPTNVLGVSQNSVTPIPGLTVDAAVSSGQASDAGQIMTVTVALLDFNSFQNDGTLSLTAPDEGPGAGGTITTDGDGSITITGSITQINADLEGLTYNSPKSTAGDDSVIVETTQGVAFEGEIITACYLAGTRIATEGEAVAIETLRIGDAVRTCGGRMRSIRWIGRRSYDGRFAAANRNVWPILIRAGALDAGLPSRDLYVSPRHAMFLDGVLIPAGELVNGVTILRGTPMGRVDYYHVELDTHDIILAEGAPSESYNDHDNRQMFHNAAEYAALYPQHDPQPAQDCAPRLEQGAIVEAVRASLTARAIAQGHAAPHVHSITLDRPGTVHATIPAGVSQVHLLSGCGRVPGDHRILGALVREIRIDGTGLNLEDPRLIRGFHVAERHGGEDVRWTNGGGVIALSYSDSARCVELVIGAVRDAPPTLGSRQLMVAAIG
jgi:hypothetical protein